MLIDLFGLRKYDYDKAEGRFQRGERMTFWVLYKQALIAGDYSEWREKCFIAKRQGMSMSTMLRASELAFLTNISLPFAALGVLYGIVQAFFWLLERL